jgi:hypothetical protein
MSDDPASDLASSVAGAGDLQQTVFVVFDAWLRKQADAAVLKARLRSRDQAPRVTAPSGAPTK